MGPVQPNCRHAVQSSLLDGQGAGAYFRRGLSARLTPTNKGGRCIDYANRILKEACLTSPLDVPGLPQGRWIVFLEKDPPDGFAAETPPLLCAAILGLSSQGFYFPSRPLVWTHDRLSRAITLYQVDTFYEN